jgi:Plasmid encoded RepA protein
MSGDQPAFPGFKPVGELLPAIKKPSRIKSRLIEASTAIAEEDPDEIYFQHTIFCQTGLPYRDPGDECREWERTQGNASLFVAAGTARDPRTRERIRLGLPFGPKPRLILAYLNTQALRTGSPDIDVEDSLTAFVKRIRLATKGARSAPSRISSRGFRRRKSRSTLSPGKTRPTISTRLSCPNSSCGLRRTSGSAFCGRRP